MHFKRKDAVILSLIKSPAFLSISLVFLFSLVLRFFSLADRPFHHDESIHAAFSYMLAHSGLYEYSAKYHGPLLYFVTSVFLLGPGDLDFLARFPVALTSCFLILFPLAFKNRLGFMTAFCALAFLSISPTITYYSRFLREDIFVLVWLCLLFYGLFIGCLEKKILGFYLVALSFALQFVTKENALAHLCILLSFFVLFFHKKLKKLSFNIHYVACFFIFIFIFTLFFTNFFQSTKGNYNAFLDGLYRESFLYWWEQNKIRRIDGGFSYYIPLLLNYEFILLPFLISAFIRLLKKREIVRFFLWYWFFANFIFYSSVGEKTPWLGLYILLPLIFIAALECKDIFAQQGNKKRYALLWLACALPLTLVKTIRVNFLHPTNPFEILILQQSTEEIQVLGKWLSRVGQENPHRDIHIAIARECLWPLAWYLIKTPNIHYYLDFNEDYQHYDALIVDPMALSQLPPFGDFLTYGISLRKWWVIPHDRMGYRLLVYFFTGKPSLDSSPQDNSPAAELESFRILFLQRLRFETGSPFTKVERPQELQILQFRPSL